MTVDFVNIPNLPAATALSGIELIEGVQAGTSVAISTQLLFQYIGGTAARITLDKTAVTGGSTGRLLYDNAGLLGELPSGGTGQLLVGSSGAAPTWQDSAVVTGWTVVPTLAALKALPNRPAEVLTQGYYAANDGGGGPPWQWVAGSTTTADDFMVVQCTSGAPGRYIRQLQAGADVSPLWAGCGLGVLADDSTQFQKVFNYGRAVNASGGTYKVKGVSVPLGATCASLYSDGTAVFNWPPGTTVNDYMLTILKTDGFTFRNLRFIGNISTDPLVQPIGNRFIAFSSPTSTYSVDCFVEDCHLEGGTTAINYSGNFKNAKALHNYIKGTWGDGISGPNCADGLTIFDNMLEDGGYATGGPQPSGAIRIGLGTAAFTSTLVSITHNHIRNYCLPASQSAIDVASGSEFNVDISHNVIYKCGGSIEFKTSDDPSAPENTYKNFTCCENTFTLLNDRSTSAITVFYSTPTVPTAKGGNFRIAGNHISCETPPLDRLGVLGISVIGFDQIDIKGNTIYNLNVGISVDGRGVASVDTANDITISGNTIDVTEVAVGAGAGTLNRLIINNNPLLKGNRQGLALNGGAALTGLVITGNFIYGVAFTGAEIRNATGDVIRNNTVWGGQNAILSQGVADNNLVIEENRLRTYVNPAAVPAIAVAVTNPGVGLTNGTRTFTVTSGTGTEATIFQCTVTGGAISDTPVLIRLGKYSVFPTTPTVSVDSGIVGGATFTMSPAVAGYAIDLRPAGTGNVVQNNNVDVPPGMRTILPGSGGFVAANNVRGIVLVDPNTTNAGVVGDVLYNGALAASTDPIYWECIVTGSVGTVVWSPVRSLPTTSAQLAAQITDETGSGALVFATSPTLVTPTLGNASATTLQMGNGTLALPSLTFAAALGSGLSRTASIMSLSVEGKEMLRLTLPGASNNYIQFGANNTPTITAVEGSGGTTSLQLQGAGGAGVDIQGGTPMAYIARFTAPGGTNVNYVQLSSSAATNAPAVAVAGNDTNIDLSITTKGTGLPRFNNAGIFAANAAVATVLGSLGPTGSRTAVQKWLTIKDNAGNPFYIPCF